MNSTVDETDLPFKVTASVLGVAALIIVVTNSLVFILYAKFKKLHRKSNYCLVSLSVSNILIALVAFPLSLVCNAPGKNLQYCTAMDVVTRGIFISTIFHILLATLDRYLKISSPFRHRVLVTGNRIIATLVIVWIVSIGISTVKLALNSNPDHGSRKTYRETTMAIACVAFGIILVVNVHTRWIVIKRVKKSRQLSANNRNTQKHQKVVLLYLVLATTCFVLGPVLYFILGAVKLPQKWWISLVFFLLIYSAFFINPFLYTFFKPDFRDALKEIIYKRNSNHPATDQETSLHILQKHEHLTV